MNLMNWGCSAVIKIQNCVFSDQNIVVVRVHIVAQRANRYIVAFRIAISRYRRIFTYQDGGGSQAQGLQMAGCDVVVCGSVHLRTQIRRIFRIHKLKWIIFLRFFCQEFLEN